MAGRLARRHKPRIRGFSQRLLAAGQPKQVVLVPSVRALLLICKAVVRSDTAP